MKSTPNLPGHASPRARISRSTNPFNTQTPARTFGTARSVPRSHEPSRCSAFTVTPKANACGASTVCHVCQPNVDYFSVQSGTKSCVHIMVQAPTPWLCLRARSCGFPCCTTVPRAPVIGGGLDVIHPALPLQAHHACAIPLVSKCCGWREQI
jgi:hypothetical protein